MKEIGVEAVVDSDGVLWFNKIRIEEGLDHKNLRVTTVKYFSEHRKHRYELVDEPEKQLNIIFTCKELPSKP